MHADIAVIGGSGLYSLIPEFEECRIETRYGAPSDAIAIGSIASKSVAFIARHGVRHTIPPHKVPYKANIAALKELGVSRIIATSSVGSLNPEYKPGDIAFVDQFVNMTSGRDDTFFHETPVTHVSTAEPYCPELRKLGSDIAGRQGLKFHNSGTVVVIQGPRFSTKAESRAFGRQGFDLIGMTQYPEAVLAREQCMCYMCIAMVTDYDAGLEGNPSVKPVNAQEISDMFAKNVSAVKQLLVELIRSTPAQRNRCACKNALDNAVMTKKE
jgi:5'-methylthioadenosine phosphorylase